MKNKLQNFWQAPGSKRLFSDKLNKDFKSLRNPVNGYVFYTLQYFYLKQKEFVVYDRVNADEVKKYVFSMTGRQSNKTLAVHLIKPLIFYGFIKIYEDQLNNLPVKRISITQYGIDFYLNWQELLLDSNDEQKHKLLIEQFIRNSLFIFADFKCGAFRHPFTFNLKPFPILFTLLLENENCLSRNFINNELVFITNFQQFNLIIENISNLNVSVKQNRSHSYDKFDSWVIKMLVGIGVLNYKNGLFSIHISYKEFIFNLLDLNEKNSTYVEKYRWMFDEKQDKYDVLKDVIDLKQKTRNYAIIKEALKDTAECRFKKYCINNIGGFSIHHDTFLKNDELPYFEVHHILPFKNKYANYLTAKENKDVDSIENLIPICPLCHRFLTSGKDKDKEPFINAMYSELSEKGWTFVTSTDLKMIYYLDRNYLITNLSSSNGYKVIDD
ncbi:HNH endonuclease signature motif containing protein [Ureaplasma canigenitalium]|uniref:HNH endonuclease signature motif containing protein n=1 Tax=Ureaplasma canigenitalium TaxID=42092 RepID=UPI0004E1E5A7|nr:HNH endonuclease signature motif containing protein [Ureaplasma canigenitalium]